MTAITREFRLYTNAGLSIPPVIHVNQYDQGETWNFKLYQPNGQQFIPTDAAIVGVKADGNLIANAGTVSDGVVVITETEQMTAAPGKAVFEILLDGDTHGTANFVVLVEASPTNDGVASESDLSLFQEAIDSTSPAAIAQGVSDWMDEHLTPTTPVVDDTLTVQRAAADAKKTGDEITDLKSAISTLTSIPYAVKQAMDTIFQNVAFKDNNEYRDELNVFHAWATAATLLSISAVYTQSGNVYEDTPLDSLKVDLVVTANYDNGTSGAVTGYTLTGTLAEGTSTITVTYEGKTATFSVTVSPDPIPSTYTKYDYIGMAVGGVSLASAQQIHLKEYANMNALGCECWGKPLTGLESGHGTAFFGRRTASGSTSSYALYAHPSDLGYHLHGVDSTNTPSMTIDTVNHVVYTNTASSPSYLKTNDNKPVAIAWANNNTIAGSPTLFGNPVNYGSQGFQKYLEVGQIKFFDLSGELVSHYFPVVRNSDNVIGMFDIVDQTFYTASTATNATIGNSNCKYRVGNWS